MNLRVFYIAVLFSASYSLLGQTDSCINNIELGISFPPVANESHLDFSEEHLEILNVNIIRTAESWRLREATQGEYNWAPMDVRSQWVIDNDYSWLLTIQSNGPDWACNPELQNDLSCAFSDSSAFRKYIDSLLVRYGDAIDKIQFGNEWHSEYWYIGSAKDFISAHNTVYESVQENAPQIEVVLGGFASGTMTTLSACYGYLSSVVLPDSDIVYDQDDIDSFCNNPDNLMVLEKQDSILTMCNYDIIDMHLYDDVELWPLYYHVMDSITGGGYPIIVSEMGGPNLINELPYSDEFQAERLYEYIKCVDTLGVEEVYYFKLVCGGDAAEYHMESGLIGEDLEIKPAYYVFKAMNKDCTTSESEQINPNKTGIFPNPVSDYFYFSDNKKYNYILYTISGQLVLESKQKVNRVSVQHLNEGIYIVEVELDEGVFRRFKISLIR